MASEASEAMAAMLTSRKQEREAGHLRTVTAREAMAELRATFSRRRKAGKRASHAAKLARGAQQKLV